MSSAHRVRRRYRAPIKNGGWLIALSGAINQPDSVADETRPELIDAALNVAGDAATRNSREFSSKSLVGTRSSLAQLRHEARHELLASAISWTSQMRTAGEACCARPTLESPLIMTGHQPSLVHPGVWSKNIAAYRLAQQVQGWSLNLVVDTDVLADRSIRLPSCHGNKASLTPVSFDTPLSPTTWIESRVGDVAVFSSFGHRVAQHMQTEWGIQPLIQTHWSDGVDTLHQPLSDTFTRLRHQQEVRWGIRNLEVRLSNLITTRAFRRFFLSIMQRAVEFQDQHNRTVAEYRREHHIRSQSHPVPLLTRDGRRVELPFWIWNAGERTRRPLFAEHSFGRVTLFDRHERLFDFTDTSLSADNQSAIEQLEQYFNAGVRIAPRALTTTMFCRLWLCDLFIHGIGGAVYDQMTDQLIQGFYGITPPTYLVLSGTLRLPIAVPDVSSADIRRQQRLLRELEYQPERHIVDGPVQLLAEKQAIISEVHARRGSELTKRQRRAMSATNRDRWRRLREINRTLTSRLDDLKLVARAKLSELEQAIVSRRLLESREFSAWLFPESELQQFFHALAR